MSDVNAPRVAVLMPVFNRERFVDEAIASVLDQDFTGFEFVIVDDGSTDRTPAILREWAQRDRRIVITTAPRNEGIPRALNRGLQAARAPYIARFDSDDVMMPRRLEAQAAVLDRQPEVALVSCAFDLIDVDGNYLNRWAAGEPHEVVRYFLNVYNIVGGHGQVMYRREDVLAIGGYSLDYPSSEDFELWGRLLQRGRFLSLPLVGMKQRQHDSRSDLHFAANKRRNWSSIMTERLTRFLVRTPSAAEIGALITLWRMDGELGQAAIADAISRESFSRFCTDHADRSLREQVRKRTALQWLHAAASFERRRHYVEVMRYVIRAMRWSPAFTVKAIAQLPFRSRRDGRPLLA
jgi:GT2 family glycosyltransferase